MAQLVALGRYAVGRNPFDIKQFTQMAFDDYAARRGSLELFCAISGITAVGDIRAEHVSGYLVSGRPRRLPTDRVLTPGVGSAVEG